MSINKLAVELLIQPGRPVEYLIGSDLKSTYAFIAEHRKNFSFTGNYPPTREDDDLQASAAEVASPDGGAIRDFGAGARTIADRTDLGDWLANLPPLDVAVQQ